MLYSLAIINFQVILGKENPCIDNRKDPNIEIKKEPIPISLARLKEMHILEEEENKKRE